MKFWRKGEGLEVQGWHQRGYLPHFDDEGVTQSITLRLDDSMPKTVLDRWTIMLKHLPEDEAKTVLRKRVETYLDQGYGSCRLRLASIAKIVQDSLLDNHADRYELHAWVIMPNHAHFLLTPSEGEKLASIMHSIKSYTALKANRALRREGGFWQEEYFDRRIRDEKHFATALAYIDNNPVKAKLCARPEDWRFGSARVWRGR